MSGDSRHESSARDSSMFGYNPSSQASQLNGPLLGSIRQSDQPPNLGGLSQSSLASSSLVEHDLSGNSLANDDEEDEEKVPLAENGRIVIKDERQKPKSDLQPSSQNEPFTDDDRKALENKILDFQQQVRTWQKEKLQKSQASKRKEESLWVKSLLNNLKKLNGDIDKQGDIIDELFAQEEQARLDFNLGKKKGVTSEDNLRKEIKQMKKRLQDLQEVNQQVNFANFERIQELIDEQENKMIDKQNQMHQHANCLEQLLTVLKENKKLLDICPYSYLINITPIDDKFFEMVQEKTPHGQSIQSEDLQQNNKLLLKQLRDDSQVNLNQPQKENSISGSVPVPQLLVNPFAPKSSLIQSQQQQKEGQFELPENKKERDQLQRLLDFIKRVRSNNQNTLHQGWDIDSRWDERSAQEMPNYEIQKNEEFLKQGVRNKQILPISAEVVIVSKNIEESSKLIFDKPLSQRRSQSISEPMVKKKSSLKIVEEFRD